MIGTIFIYSAGILSASYFVKKAYDFLYHIPYEEEAKIIEKTLYGERITEEERKILNNFLNVSSEFNNKRYHSECYNHSFNPAWSKKKENDVNPKWEKEQYLKNKKNNPPVNPQWLKAQCETYNSYRNRMKIK